MYTEEVLVGSILPASSAPFTALTLTGAPAVYSVFHIGSRVKVKRIMFKVSTLVANNTIAAQVAFYQRPTPGSTSGEVLLGTLIIPTAAAVGKVIYKDLQSVSLACGQDLVVKLSVTGTDSGTAAGAGFALFEAILDPEDARSEANMVLSA